jgi:RNA ligase
VLVEIVYPANRIVVDYQGLDDLILLGAVDIATGRTFGPDAVPDWPGPVVDTFAYATLAEALAAPPRDGREGLVVHLLDTDERVKIKYAEYVRLHRLVTGLTARTVWEVLVAGGDLDALTQPLPDEFHAWVRAVATKLSDDVEVRAEAVEAEFAALVGSLPAGWGRREFAARAVRSEHRGALFLRLDGKDYRPGLWQLVRPAGDLTPHGVQVSEE